VVTFDAIETPTPAIRWIRNAFDASWTRGDERAQWRRRRCPRWTTH